MKYLLAILCVALVGCTKNTREDWCAIAAATNAELRECTRLVCEDAYGPGHVSAIAYRQAEAQARCDWKKPEVERD